MSRGDRPTPGHRSSSPAGARIIPRGAGNFFPVRRAARTLPAS